MTRILIPTDFSSNAWNAILYGLELFKGQECVIYLSHVQVRPVFTAAESTVTSNSLELRDQILRDRKRNLEDLVLRIRDKGLEGKHTFATLASSDFFVDSIKSQVEDYKIDLIIMGTRGASGLKKITLGSNTGNVITKVKCPVLVVPEDAVYEKLNEIVFPTDYQINYDLGVLEVMVGLIRKYQSNLRILHIATRSRELTAEQEKNKDLLHEYLNGAPHSFHTLRGTSIETSLQCFIESRDIQMVVMVAKNLNFLQRILFRPIVEKFSYHTEIPFLVLHE